MLKTRYGKEVESTMKNFFESLNEKDRRRYAAIEAIKLGDGGQQYICEILGIAPITVRKGLEELQCALEQHDRIREPGGGKKKLLK